MKPLSVALGLALAALCGTASAQQRAGDVRYTCGGVGSDERRMLDAARKDARLELVFVTAKRGGYVAGAAVTVTREGKQVAAFDAEGPLCLLDLPGGTYRIEARLGEASSSRVVKVPAAGRGPRAVFAFPDEPSDGIEASEEEKRQAREP